VVGKFLADSLETVLGATELVGKVGGTLSIISAILITLVPVIKIAIIAFVYKVISSICQMVNNNKALGNVIDFFASIYKDMLGIIIGTMVIFISVTGIIMHTISKIT
jgi:stage III sporulation protein AE